MNTPNKLTVFRILMVPILVFFLLYKNIEWRFSYALIVFMIASYTDHLDGKIAREKSLVTRFGQFADPLADKILILSAFICFIEIGLIGALPVIIILAREFAVTSVRLAAMGHGKVIAANKWGKAKTLGQILAVMSAIAVSAAGDVLKGIMDAGNFLNYNFYSKIFVGLMVWISVALSVISGIIYIYRNIDFIKDS